MRMPLPVKPSNYLDLISSAYDMQQPQYRIYEVSVRKNIEAWYKSRNRCIRDGAEQLRKLRRLNGTAVNPLALDMGI